MTWTATNSEGFAAPAALAVDAVVLTADAAGLHVLALRQADGKRALPGGLVPAGEDPLSTARRVLTAKTAIDEPYLEQLGAFAAPERDPRGWIPTIAHLALVPADTVPADPQATWVNARGRVRWAYDHREIVTTAIDRVEGRLWWSNVAVGILPGAFTLSAARQVYEAIAGRVYDPATFARDLKATGLIEPTGESRQDGPGRPAALFRFRARELTWGSGRRKRVAV